MSAQTDPTTQVAAKKHSCSWCAEAIGVGERYTRYRYFDGGDAGTVKMHPECYADMQEICRLEGGWLEWVPGDAERPKADA